jgi:hypothetical protein
MPLSFDADLPQEVIDPLRRVALFNHAVETNRRPAVRLDAGRQFESAPCALPFPSAAVAHFIWR